MGRNKQYVIDELLKKKRRSFVLRNDNMGDSLRLLANCMWVFFYLYKCIKLWCFYFNPVNECFLLVCNTDRLSVIPVELRITALLFLLNHLLFERFADAYPQTRFVVYRLMCICLFFKIWLYSFAQSDFERRLEHFCGLLCKAVQSRLLGVQKK